jgi:hypothetical protein
MSAQTDASGITLGPPLRDGSDYTKLLKQRAVFREKTVSLFTGKPNPLSIIQSAEYRLDNILGAPGCTACGER